MTTRINRPEGGRNIWKIAAVVLTAVLVLLAVGFATYLVASSNEPRVTQTLGATTRTQTTTVSATTTTSSSKRTTPVTTTTQVVKTTEPKKTTPVPEKAAGMQETFKGIYLPATRLGWEEIPERSTNYRKVFVDTTRCGSVAYQDNCPWVVVLNLRTAPKDALLFDSNPDDQVLEGKKITDANCWWNQAKDNAYYGEPVVQKPRVVYGGTAWDHAIQDGCGFPDRQHSWESLARDVLVYETGTSDTTAETPYRVVELISGMVAA